MECLLCQNLQVPKYRHYRGTDFFRCSNCDLIMKPTQLRLTELVEKERYDSHENDLTQAGYRHFLETFLQAIKPFFHEKSVLLDYGCGPTPALQILLQDKVDSVVNFDPFYSPQGLDQKFDGVLCHEVAEHFHEPRKSWCQMMSLVSREVFLALRTGIFREQMSFESWHYHRDPTHMVFYTPKTIEHIARSNNKVLTWKHPDIVVFS